MSTGFEYVMVFIVACYCLEFQKLIQLRKEKYMNCAAYLALGVKMQSTNKFIGKVKNVAKKPSQSRGRNMSFFS